MKEKPILFNTEMVQAILDGRKTQTRRTMKPQPVLNGLFWEWHGAGWSKNMGKITPVYGHLMYDKCPYNPGDILWVRETWCLTQPRDPESYFFSYKAYNQLFPVSDWEASEKYDYSTPDVWKPSIHMPKEAARIWLKVTDVRCERLQDISEGDAIDEGLFPIDDKRIKKWQDYLNVIKKGYFHDPRLSFWTLWKSIYGPDSWMENPWVWVYEFDVLSTTGKP